MMAIIKFLLLHYKLKLFFHDLYVFVTAPAVRFLSKFYTGLSIFSIKNIIRYKNILILAISLAFPMKNSIFLFWLGKRKNVLESRLNKC